MPPSTLATVVLATLATLLPVTHLVASPFEVKDVRLGSNLLAAYHTLKARYGDTIAVKQWRQLDTETISLIANRNYCGASQKAPCEKMTVSSVLPLYREQVVRIELNQTFIRQRKEEDVVSSLRHKYGDPFFVSRKQQGRTSSTVMLWTNNSKVPATMIENAKSWVDYRILGASFLVTQFDIGRDGMVSGLTMVAENHDLQERNREALNKNDYRYTEALIRDELHY